MASKHIVRLTFTDGKTMQFEFTPPEGAELGRATNFEQFVTSNYVMIELEGSLALYPVHAIQSIEITPLLEPLPRGVIRGARRLG